MRLDVWMKENGLFDAYMACMHEEWPKQAESCLQRWDIENASLSKQLTCSFEWDKTEQGMDFWYNLYQQFRLAEAEQSGVDLT
jgi:hypothetical protein